MPGEGLIGVLGILVINLLRALVAGVLHRYAPSAYAWFLRWIGKPSPATMRFTLIFLGYGYLTALAKYFIHGSVRLGSIEIGLATAIVLLIATGQMALMLVIWKMKVRRLARA